MVDLKRRFLIETIVIIGYTNDILALRCSFVTPDGVLLYKFCDNQCCEGSNRNASNVCCNYGNDGMYIGVGISTTILLALIVYCCLYAGCRRKLNSNTLERPNGGRNFHIRRLPSNTGSDNTQQHVIPSVSVDVAFILPPPYEDLPPPPYNSYTKKTLNKEGRNDGLDPDEQPPAYTSCQMNQ